GSTNTKYAMFDLEDMHGIMRSIVWPEDFARSCHFVEADRILAVRGVIDKRPGSEEANLIINELIPLEDLANRYTKSVRFSVDEQKQGIKGLEQLYEIVRGYPGKCEVQIVLCLADESRVVCQCDGLKIEPSPEMRTRVTDLLGAGHLRLVAGATTAP